MAGLLRMASRAGNMAQNRMAAASNLMDRAQSASNALGVGMDMSEMSGINDMQDMQNMQSIPQASTRLSTYILSIICIFLLVGVILLLVSRAKCTEDAQGSACKNNKNTGIGFTVCASLCFIFILWMRIKIGI